MVVNIMNIGWKLTWSLTSEPVELVEERAS
jgi:hypothetical protein